MCVEDIISDLLDAGHFDERQALLVENQRALGFVVLAVRYWGRNVEEVIACKH